MAAAKRSGMTAHAFTMEAIAEKTQQAGLHDDFDAVAEQRYAKPASWLADVSKIELAPGGLQSQGIAETQPAQRFSGDLTVS